VLDYKQAGVDIAAGDQLVTMITPWAAQTNRAGVLHGIGGFGSVFDPRAAGFEDPLIVSTTDGVGTKLLLALKTNLWQHIGQDLVAMCVNDLLAQGAHPQYFLDYYATGKLDVNAAAQVVSSIAQACKLAGCALVGGETAELPGMYADGHVDLAGFAVGLVERDCLLPKNIQRGDVILGLASSGFHSNGYSLIRKIVDHMDLDAACGWNPSQSLGEALMTPTRIYANSLVPLFKQQLIQGCAHITGGGLRANFMRILDPHMDCTLSWKIPQEFYWMQTQGKLANEELYQVFNCGIGMAVVMREQVADQVRENLIMQGEQVQHLGYVL
jgi:phosphoribosylformylglycinamidine cyclo-ligase